MMKLSVRYRLSGEIYYNSTSIQIDDKIKDLSFILQHARWEIQNTEKRRVDVVYIEKHSLKRNGIEERD